MRKGIILASLICVMALASYIGVNAEGPIQISECGVLNESESYILTNDITNNGLTGHCIIIGESEITLDCNGYKIRSDDAYAGVYSNQVYTEIKNCDITMDDSVGGAGIVLYDADYAYVHDNIVDNQGMGIGVYYTTGADIVSNQANGNKGYGIRVISGSNNDIEYNTANSGNSWGIWVESSSGNYLEGNTANSNVNADGIHLYQSDNNDLIDNTANSNSLGNGIILSSSSGNYLEDNTANSNYNSGIRLYSNSDNNVIEKGDLTGNTGSDVSVTSSSDNNVFLNVFYSDESVSNGGGLTRKWYYRAKFQFSNGTGIAWADVTAYDKNDNVIDTSFTLPNGWTPGSDLMELIDYVNYDGTKTYYSPYNITAVKGDLLGYHEDYDVTYEEANLLDIITAQY